jgi:hypothetical protein
MHAEGQAAATRFIFLSLSLSLSLPPSLPPSLQLPAPRAPDLFPTSRTAVARYANRSRERGKQRAA